MAATELTRTGSFDLAKLGGVAGQLLAAWPGAQVYGTPTGFRVVWPNGLTAPQATAAQAAINAYVERTDLAGLPPLLQQAITYLQLPSPTAAQTTAAVRGLVKYAIRQYTDRDSIDGINIT